MIAGILGSGDASEITPLIWQGGCPADMAAVAPAGFSLIVLCAAELQPTDANEARALFPGVKVHCAPMNDNGTGPTWDEIPRAHKAADHVADNVRAGRKVLVTCAAGRNRSGLVTALALTRLYGISGREAIGHVRARRYGALTNAGFVEFLSRIK